MGKARKKKEKRADFAKTKLKVGKTKPKPANYTDTSFKSRSIALPSQTLDNAFLEGEARRTAAFDHQLAMTRHYAENQRKDAVMSLHNHLSQNLAGPSNATSLSPLITHLAPLILDTASAVRSALLALLGDLSPALVPREALQAHLAMLLLYIQSAMTHIQSDIRSDSSKFLAWALDIGGPEVVRGSWVKVLASYSGLLGWSVGGQEKSRIQLARGSSMVGNINVTARHVSTLFTLLSMGLSQVSSGDRPSRPKTLNYTSTKTVTLQHPLIQCYLLPTHSAPFAHLNLFRSGQTDPQLSSHDVPSRRTQFEPYISPVLVYLHDLAAELVPSGLSRQPNHQITDDLRITVIRILGLLKQVYLEVEEGTKRPWDKEWKKCVKKLASLIEERSQHEGSRRVVREWELANFS